MLLQAAGNFDKASCCTHTSQGQRQQDRTTSDINKQQQQYAHKQNDEANNKGMVHELWSLKIVTFIARCDHYSRNEALNAHVVVIALRATGNECLVLRRHRAEDVRVTRVEDAHDRAAEELAARRAEVVVVAGEVVHARLREHRVVLDLRLAERLRVRGNEHELGCSAS